MGDQVELVRRAAQLHDRLAGGDLLLLEATRQALEHRHVVESPKQWQLGQGRGDHRRRVSDIGEGHPPVTDRVVQPPVHPVDATVDLDPREHLQQPPRRDPLHLWGRLGGRRQVAGGPGPQAQLRPAVAARGPLPVQNTDS